LTFFEIHSQSLPTLLITTNLAKPGQAVVTTSGMDSKIAGNQFEAPGTVFMADSMAETLF